MNIIYDNKIAKKIVDEKAIKRFYGQLADKILERLSLLIVAEKLSDIPNIPPTRRHKLVGNYYGCWGIEVSKNWRIIIMPLRNEDSPDQIDEIKIIDIVDYH